MSELSALVPYKILQKHRTQLHIEAILLGVVGLLSSSSEESYVGHLIKEFEYYWKKYSWH
jgi:hypothetical protein